MITFRLLALPLLVLTVAGCSGVPAAGPSANDIVEETQQENAPNSLVFVTRPMLAHLPRTSSGGFGNALRNAAAPNTTIQSTDTLRIAIFENAEAELITNSENSATVIEGVTLDDDGYIFVPYAGRIEAAGKTVEGLRSAITEALSTQTPNPQITITRTRGDDQTVSLVGALTNQGSHTLTPTTAKLTQAIAASGGVSIAPESALVRLSRGSHRGWVRFSELFANPAQDITLQAGDRVLVEADTRRFTVVGATGRQQQVPFTAADVTAMDALAQSGGLDTNRADPTGLFILRTETPRVASAVLGTTVEASQQLVYTIDLTKPSGMLLANDFPIRDKDIVYVTEAPLSQWQKIMSTITGSAQAITSTQAIGG